MNPRFRRHSFAALLAWLLCSALYLWTARAGSGSKPDWPPIWMHYTYLINGFLNGHTSLSLAPAPELLALPDPYEPTANELWRLHDASLFEGKFYLYYGPTPVVLLTLPWKVLTGSDLKLPTASVAFAVAGFGALALLVARIRRRFFPKRLPALYSSRFAWPATSLGCRSS